MFKFILYKDTIFFEIIIQKSSFFTLFFSKSCSTYNTARKQVPLFLQIYMMCRIGNQQ